MSWSWDEWSRKNLLSAARNLKQLDIEQTIKPSGSTYNHWHSQPSSSMSNQWHLKSGLPVSGMSRAIETGREDSKKLPPLAGQTYHDPKNISRIWGKASYAEVATKWPTLKQSTDHPHQQQKKQQTSLAGNIKCKYESKVQDTPSRFGSKRK